MRQGALLDANPHNTAISTYTGVSFDILDQSTWVFTVEDIATALANICRFAGHVKFYSVGEHCIRVQQLLKDWGCQAECQLLGLLHDASEAYLLDIPRPWKGKVSIDGRPYYEVEHEIETKLFDHFGVLEARRYYWNIVKEADMALYLEEDTARPFPSILNRSPRAVANMYTHILTDLQSRLGGSGLSGVA